MNLTTRLRAAHPIHTATHHPFLRAAGRGILPHAVLSAWLLQDTLYTRAYIRLLGGLLAGIGALLPAALPTSSTTSSSLPLSPGQPPPSSHTPYPRIFALLIAALANIHRETALFAATAARHRLFSLTDAAAARPASATRAYVDLFVALGGVAAGGSPRALLEGLVALWATERCYFDAWSYAAECVGEREGLKEWPSLEMHASIDIDDDDAPAASADPQAQADEALRTTLIPNWTSPEFGAFVDECGTCVDALAAVVLGEHGEQGEHDEHDEATAADADYRACEDVFRQVVWLEERFWPDVDARE